MKRNSLSRFIVVFALLMLLTGCGKSGGNPSDADFVADFKEQIKEVNYLDDIEFELTEDFSYISQNYEFKHDFTNENYYISAEQNSSEEIIKEKFIEDDEWQQGKHGDGYIDSSYKFSEEEGFFSTMTTTNGYDIKYQIHTTNLKDNVSRMYLILLYKDIQVVVSTQHNKDYSEVVESNLMEIVNSISFAPLEELEESDEVNEINYQSKYHLASDEGYDFLAKAYMYSNGNILTDTFTPMSDTMKYDDEGEILTSQAHGVRLLQSFHWNSTAKNLINTFYEVNMSRDKDFTVDVDKDVEITYDEERDMAYKKVHFIENSTGINRVAYLVAENVEDELDDTGAFRLLFLTYIEEDIDENYEALLTELSEAFNFEFPVMDSFE